MKTMHSARTKLLAVIGDPIGHSMSPVLHGRALAAAGLDYAYLAFHVPDAAAAIAAMRSLGIRGYSVTVPHKESVIPHLDRLEAPARRCGSVNTIVNEDGVLTGTSTDGAGAVAALRAAGVDPARKRVLIVGTGGAARAVAFALLDAGVASIAFRAAIPEQRLRLESDLEAIRPGIVRRAEEAIELLVNATPIGMNPRIDALPVEEELLRPGLAVFDIVYNPVETRLLGLARAAGCVTVDGVGMFVEQAALQFELFTGAAAPRELMRRTVLEALKSGS